MICPNCNLPMKTKNGSEKGEIRDDYYFTQEIKVCPECNREVLETYEAKLNETIEQV